MKTTKRHLRIIAIFLLLNTINYIVFPIYSLALTAGPTSPEASSFEPVDTTDMVNLLTGDFTYNIPLLEVPGPAGGYPVTLAYHAGIQTNQEASWVGLGWSLNPGAINRMVNGYADDHENVENVDRAFWEGGNRESYKLGVSVGIANVASVGAGLSWGNDTYRGFGVGFDADISAKVGGNNSPLGASIGVGVSPFGDSYSSSGIQVGIGTSNSRALSLTANAGLSYNSATGFGGGVSGGLGWNSNGGNNGSLLGASIATGGTNPSLSIGGGRAGVHNSKSGNISTNSNSFGIDVPVYPGLNIRLGYDYTRYWIDETVDVYTSGSLYFPKVNYEVNHFDNHAYDTYDLKDTDIDVEQEPAEVQVLGGSFPDFDNYSVLAQGLSGNIRPFLFQKNLYRQNKKENNTYLVQQYSFDIVDKPVEFRFVNDFSNRFLYEPSNFTKTETHPLSFGFDDSMQTGKNGKDGYVKNHLAGSKHIKYFTNRQLRNTETLNSGFINNQTAGFFRDDNTQIGGFMITNESGVNYHYSLPAYSFDEFLKSENTEKFKTMRGDYNNTLSKPEKYAYTWHLTAVTGPDFIDSNNNSIVDDGDLGYWVSFEYGKWTDHYQWRNPGEGFNKDIDGEFQNFSYGKKEVYYLDAIRTASHTALFIKQVRNDGKGVTSKLGGYDPLIDEEEQTETFPASVLGLKEIYLFKNESFSFNDLSAKRSDGIDHNYLYQNCLCCELGDQYCIIPKRTYGNCDESVECDSRSESRTVSISSHMGDNIIDETDFENGELRDKTLKVINFNTDYSLCNETANSYSNLNYYSYIRYAPSAPKTGKLTLKALNFLGMGGASIMPQTKFEYVKNPDYNKEAYDVWGFYKSDYPKTEQEKINENIDHLTTDVSSIDVDAWSLTKIISPLGASIEIEYESDTYENTELAKQNLLRIKDIVDKGNGQLEIFLFEDVNLDKIYDLEDIIAVQYIGEYFYTDDNVVSCECSFAREDPLYAGYKSLPFRSDNSKVVIINNSTNSIVVEDINLHSGFISKPQFSIERLNNWVFEDCSLQTVICTYEAKYTANFIAGGIITNPQRSKAGGGLRVRNLVTSLDQNHSSATSYEYMDGSTSFEPFSILPPLLNPKFEESLEGKSGLSGVRNSLKKMVLDYYEWPIRIARELPGPGVMYKSVKIKESNSLNGQKHNIPYYSKYTYEVYDKEMNVKEDDEPVTAIPQIDKYYNDIKYDRINYRNITYQDYTTRVGNLNEITLFDLHSNEPISTTKNHYLSDDTYDYQTDIRDKFNNQGVIEETFGNARFVKYLQFQDYNPYGWEANKLFYKDEYHLLGIISRKETFPSILMGQTNVNYKTGITTKSENLAFDFYSGMVKEKLTTDSYGNQYLSESTPAYEKYPKMGLKVDDQTNKHMLTQEAATYLFKVNNETELTPTGLLTASIQTWSNTTPVLKHESQPEVWRKEAGYTFNSLEELNTDGTYKIIDSKLPSFNWANPSTDNNWEKLSQITFYDHYSHALEAVDLNGNFAATKMDYKQEKIIASAANASYHEMAFSGAEYTSGISEPEGGVSAGSGSASIAFAHTGKFSLQVNPSTKGFTYVLNSDKVDLNKKYRASVWVYLPGNAESDAEIGKVQLFYTVNGLEVKKVFPTRNKSKSKTWYLLNLDIDPSANGNIEIFCRNNASRGVYFDDFRVHPLDAAMTAYVYDNATDKLTDILDATNFYTHYDYDAAGRLIKVRKERLNFDFGEGKETFRADQILSETIYNFGSGTN